MRARAAPAFAPLAIGLALTLIQLIGIPVTNTSVSPARSTAVAVQVGDRATRQPGPFRVAPVTGAILGAAVYRILGMESPAARGPAPGSVAHP
ncbi:aquaporin [Massilia sp. KIM]|uniref:aquaporin n=1 Tax=Massilia sp. KIM TaxID=1955422 RepID=UPI0022773628|nr:aquaporin [Massilia sp. KIM]